MQRNIVKAESAPGVEERMPMDGKDAVLELSCFNRYRFAGQFTEGKIVVDAACADGYGIDYLNAKEYIGLDYSKEALDKAKKNHGKQGVFKKANLETREIPDCDVLVTFETLEHLEDPIGFLKRASKHVKEKIVLSVPNNETPGDNQFHKWIFNENDFKDIVSGIFPNTEFYQQDDKTIGNNIYPMWIVAVINL